MEIRLAEIDDLPLLAKVGRKFHQDAGFDKVQSYDEQGIQDSFFALLNNPLGILITAWDEGKFAGAIAGGIYPNFYDPRESILQAGFVCVMEEYRKGEATGALVGAFEEWGKAKGANILTYMSNTKEWAKQLKDRGFVKTDTVWAKRMEE